MKILGIDIATSTGFCIAEGERYATGKWTVAKLKDKGDAYVQNAILATAFRQWLWAMIVANEIDFVAIEEPLRSDLKRARIEKDPNNPLFGVKSKEAITSFATIYRLYGLSVQAIAVCQELGVPFAVVPQQTWRSAFVGKKAAGEDWKQAARRTCALMKIDAKSDDAAEAAGVAFWAQVHLKQARGQASAPLFEHAGVA